MSHAIMRIQKIKSSNSLAERERHNTRTKEVLSADGSNNVTVDGIRGLVKHVKDLEKDIDSKNTRKTRKDAIKAIEVLFTSDKSFFKRVDHNQYFDECKKWLQATFGEENLLQLATHLDEETPHLHAILSTVKNGKFNYSGYVGGRQDLRALQDSFFAQVEHLGLQRGQKVELTKATYQSGRDWHKNVEKARTEAEALSPEHRLDYAVKGLMAEEEIEKLEHTAEELNERVMIMAIEQIELTDKYEGIRRGALQVGKGDTKFVEKMEQWGIQKNIEERQQKQKQNTYSKEIDEMGL